MTNTNEQTGTTRGDPTDASPDAPFNYLNYAPSGTDLTAAQEMMTKFLSEGGLTKGPSMLVVFTDGEVPLEPAADEEGSEPLLVVGDIHGGKSDYTRLLAEMHRTPLIFMTMDEQGNLQPPLSDILAHELEHRTRRPSVPRHPIDISPLGGLFFEPSLSMCSEDPCRLCGMASVRRGYGNGKGLLDLLAGPDNSAVDALLERLAGDQDKPSEGDASK